MARISYDDQTATAYKAVREVSREGLSEWREAVRRHLRPSPGMTVVDIGAGTGAFSAAFSYWFGVSVVAVEPSAAMRAQIPRRPGIAVLEGQASAMPLPGGSADGAWMSLMIHHVADLGAAAREVRRVLRHGAPLLIRQAYPDRFDPARTFPWEFFPETARSVGTFPTLGQVCDAFATAGLHREALEPVPEKLISMAEFLDKADSYRRSDTNIRSLTEEEFQRGKEHLRRAVQDADPATRTEPMTSWLEILVLR